MFCIFFTAKITISSVAVRFWLSYMFAALTQIVPITAPTTASTIAASISEKPLQGCPTALLLEDERLKPRLWFCLVIPNPYCRPTALLLERPPIIYTRLEVLVSGESYSLVLWLALTAAGLFRRGPCGGDATGGRNATPCQGRGYRQSRGPLAWDTPLTCYGGFGYGRMAPPPVLPDGKTAQDYPR